MSNPTYDSLVPNFATHLRYNNTYTHLYIQTVTPNLSNT